MSCTRTRIDRVFLVCWEDGPVTMADAQDLPRDLLAAQKEAGQQLFYLAIAGPEVPAPTDDVRSVMSRHMQEMLDVCSSMHLVFEGSGFRHTMQRMAMVTIMLLSKRQDRVFIESSVPNALKNAPPKAATELRRALIMAFARGLLQRTPERDIGI